MMNLKPDGLGCSRLEIVNAFLINMAGVIDNGKGNARESYVAPALRALSPCHA